jgi:hypothetical protein
MCVLRWTVNAAELTINAPKRRYGKPAARGYCRTKKGFNPTQSSPGGAV